MGIFDIIGPVMIGPSSSHTAGAARIGRVAGRILGEPLKEAKITLYGSFAKTGKGHGTDRALAAGLMGYAPDSGSIRDALHIAEEKEIPISFALSEDDMGHPNVAKIEAYGKNGAHVTVVGRSQKSMGILSRSREKSTPSLHVITTYRGSWLRSAARSLPKKSIFPICVFSAREKGMKQS